MSAESRATYVYGVVAAADAEAAALGAGVGGSSVRCVRHEDLSAMVSEVSGDSLAAARELRAHWGVLEKAVSRATVLPVRFGTVMESEDAVREHLLAANGTKLRELLQRLSGTAQLTVKGFYDDERLLREIVRSNPAVAGLQKKLRGLPEEATYYERIRLGEAVAAEFERARQRDTELFLERLSPIALDVKVTPPTSADSAVNLAFLVRRSDVDRFSGVVAELEAELDDRMRLRYVGPLPPYSFAEADLSPAAGGHTWG